MSRRAVFGAAGVLGVGGVATALYRAAPGFWRQYAAEMQRPVELPMHFPDPGKWPDAGLHAAWIGHATVLLKIDGFTILTDPLFSERAGIDIGVTTLGVKRLVAPAVPLKALPKIDLILLSHAHMDHCDLPSLRRLESKGTTLLTSRAISDLVRRGRYGAVHELGWRESVQVGPARVTGVEVNHWGARVRTDTWRGYGGFSVECGSRRVLFAGDTAITSAFRGVRQSKPYDVAIFPIGAYNPWRRYHCTPEEAWRMGNDAGAEHFIPVHHQTLALSREPYLEPISRFYDAAGRESARIAIRDIGQTWSV